MKKILSIIMILGLCITLSGCGSDKAKDNDNKSNDNTNINDTKKDDNEQSSTNPYENKKFIGDRTGKILIINDMDGAGDVGSVTIDGITLEFDISSYIHANGEIKCSVGIDSVNDDYSIKSINVKFCELSDTYTIAD